MKPLHYFVFVVLLAAGLAGGVMVAPDAGELGLMYFKARQYPEAQRILEQRLAAGEHSIDVTVPLADLYLQSGEVDQALDLLKRFPVRPDERLALAERIAQFERYGQLTSEYLHTLERIHSIKRSEKTVRELANLYRYLNQAAPLAATLEELIRDYAATPGEFVELANLEAIGGQFSRATATLVQLVKRHPDAVTGDTVEFLISVELDAGEAGRAEEWAAWWLRLRPLPNEAVRLAGLLDARGRPGVGLRLLAPFEVKLETHPALLVEWTHLQVASGAPGKAYERLAALHRARRLPEELMEPFLDLVLARRDSALALAVAEERGWDRLPGSLLSSLAEVAMAAGRADLVERMRTGLKQGFLAAQPLLAARLALAAGDRADAMHWLDQAAVQRLRDSDRLEVAQNYLQLGRPGEALDHVSQVRLENLSAAEALEAARVYQNLGKAKSGAERFELLPRQMAGAGWALLAAATGREGAVVAWLDATPETGLSDDLLRDIYYAAGNRKGALAALECARRLYQRHGTDGNRLLLATALAGAGRPAEALPHLRALVARPDAAGEARAALEEAYTSALRDAGQHAELRQFWAAKLGHAGVDEKQRLDLIYGLLEIRAWNEALPALAELAHRRAELAPLYVESAIEAGRKPEAVVLLKAVLDRGDLPSGDREALLYALIEHGGYEVSLPYIRQLAGTASAPWAAAYEDALRKLERRAELAEFFRMRAGIPGATPEEKRSRAFQLLEAGRKDWAQPIFEELARTAKPDSSDVADLLYLWGAKPPGDAIAWMERRAREATGVERAAWWNHLVQAGAADRVAAAAVNGLPPPGQGGALLEAYLGALVRLGEGQAFGGAIDRELPALTSVDRVRGLARLARESGFEMAAEPAYARVLTLAPGDAKALHWLGSYAFSRAKYSVAEEHLSALLASSEGGSDDNFYYAEVLWRKGDRAGSRNYYGRAIRAIDRAAAPPPEVLAQRAQALARCGFVEKSLEEFRKLATAWPDKEDLRADFAAMLLENARYGEARSVLSSGGAGSRLVELRAQLLAATAQKQEALDLLEDFTGSHPDGARALAGLGLLNQSVTRNRRAQSLLRRAAALEPENEDFQTALAEAGREQEPRVDTEYTHRTTQGTQTEDLVRIIGEQVLGGALHLHFETDQDAASIQNVRSPAGTVAPFAGVVRRGELSAQYELEDGLRIEGAVYASEAGPGGGVAVVRPDAQGSSSIRLDLGKPYWDFSEALANGGTRDRIEVRRETAAGSRLSASLAAALNRYSLEQVPGAAASAAAQGRLTVRVLSRPQLGLLSTNLEYNFDGEYRLSVATRAAPGGGEFHPLPLVNREVHSAGVAVAAQPVRNLQTNAAAGFAIDRYGGRAPFITVNLNYRGRGRFTAGFDFDRRLYFLDTERTVTTIGGHLGFRF